MTSQPAPQLRDGAAPPGESAPRRVVRREDLFAGRTEVVILHDGQEYRLRITRNGKLILTK